MKLTAEIIKSAKPKTSRYWLPDGDGLILEVRPNKVKSWIVRYFIKGKEHRKYIGDFPTVDIRQAREMTQRIKGQAKKCEVINPNLTEKITFKKIAEEWFNTRIKPKSPGHAKKTRCRLDLHIYPALGELELSEIKTQRILQLCREIEKPDKDTGHERTDTAHMVKAVISQVFKFAIASGLAEIDPASMLTGALKPHKKEHYATLTKEKDIAHLMRSIMNYPDKYKVVKSALLLSALTFCRPVEIRQAEWADIDWDKKEWRIPAHKIKMKEEHTVPLSTQVIELLRELSPLTNTGDNKWLFPSERRNGRSMSENTIAMVLRTMGFPKEQMTAHGFRGMASTALNEHDWRPDYVEKQLAHKEKGETRASYNHAEWTEKRRELMQWWADYLYGLI